MTVYTSETAPRGKTLFALGLTKRLKPIIKEGCVEDWVWWPGVFIRKADTEKKDPEYGTKYYYFESRDDALAYAQTMAKETVDALVTRFEEQYQVKYAK